ncbi:hypothetical protein, partial [Streptomyces sp. SID3343]|uniref:hypothetical protein n=1 Tax=Streptomyces sp. SID3343 TaxID=2690260 RepID=UPI001F1C8E1E
MDDAEQNEGRASTAEESAGTSSTEVVEARPSRVRGQARGGAERVGVGAGDAGDAEGTRDDDASDPVGNSGASVPGSGRVGDRKDPGGSAV